MSCDVGEVKERLENERSVVGPVGKLFHQGVEVQHTAATCPTDDSIMRDPTPNIPFRGIPLVFNYVTRIFRPPDATIVSVFFPTD